MSALSDLVRLLKQDGRTGTDYTGTVTRVKGNTAFVRITGSDIMDTPVAMSIECKVGDKVRVRVSNGRAFVNGNDSNPPTHNTEDINALSKRVSAVEKRRNVSSGSLGSHIGMVIHTTTLDTMEKVIKIYGGITWIQHCGYMLRGASSGVSDNNAVSDGGATTHNHGAKTGSVTLTGAQSGVHSHGHGVYYKRANITANSSGNTHVLCHSSNSGSTNWAESNSNASGAVQKATAANATSGHDHTISSASNMPPYKDVYIWERTA